MKRVLIKLFILVITLGSCQLPDKNINSECPALDYYSENVPSDFIFKLEISGSHSYSYDSKNLALKKIITWDEKHVDTLLKLNQKQFSTIWKEIRATDILKYPKNYKSHSSITITPSPSYELLFQFDGITKVIRWTENTESLECESSYKLKELINQIDQIITSSPEYLGLPEQTYDWQ